MVTWLSEVMVDEWELWIRGPFAADLNDLEPAGLDVVLFGQPKCPASGHCDFWRPGLRSCIRGSYFLLSYPRRIMIKAMGATGGNQKLQALH